MSFGHSWSQLLCFAYSYRLTLWSNTFSPRPIAGRERGHLPPLRASLTCFRAWRCSCFCLPGGLTTASIASIGCSTSSIQRMLGSHPSWPRFMERRTLGMWASLWARGCTITWRGRPQGEVQLGRRLRVTLGRRPKIKDHQIIEASTRLKIRLKQVPNSILRVTNCRARQRWRRSQLTGDKWLCSPPRSYHRLSFRSSPQNSTKEMLWKLLSL